MEERRPALSGGLNAAYGDCVLKYGSQGLITGRRGALSRDC